MINRTVVFILLGLFCGVYAATESLSLKATFRDVWPCADDHAFGSPAPFACGAQTNDPNAAQLCKSLKPSKCSNDFEYTDFGAVYSGDSPDRGIVMNTLDSDNKPVYNPNNAKKSMRNGGAEFYNWFRTTPGYNIAIQQDLVFTTCDRAVDKNCNNNYFTKDNVWNPSNGAGYWPLDNQGFGNYWSYSGKAHNYGFSMEIATRFVYRQGDVFRFNGDDDLFIFINGKLVLDLGGVHNGLEGTINLDTLGLTPNTTYPFNVFYCERHTPGSGFYATTTIGFVCERIDRCGVCYGDGQSCCTCDKSDMCQTVRCDPNQKNQVCQVTPLPNPYQGLQCGTSSCNAQSGYKFTDTSASCVKANKCFDYSCDNSTGCISTPRTHCQKLNTKCNTYTCNPTTGGCDKSDNCQATFSCKDNAGCDLNEGCLYNPRQCNSPTNNKCDVMTCDVTSNSCKIAYTIDANTCAGCNKDSCTASLPNNCQQFTNCTNGKCFYGPKCSSNDPCLVSSCVDGKCLLTPFCQASDSCHPQTCQVVGGQPQCSPAKNPCDDNNGCTFDVCYFNSTGDMFCNNTYACDDGKMCTDDFCENGQCKHNTTVCATANLCKDISCDNSTGCVLTDKPLPDYGNKCMVTDCDPLVGFINTTYPCIPADRCKCDPAVGCQCSPLSPAAIAGITAGGIAGIAIGGAAGVGAIAFAGKKGLDYFSTGNAAAAGVQDNPMYASAQNGGENPFYNG